MRPWGLRILLTVESAGAQWRYGLELARGLARLGHEIDLASIGPRLTDEQRSAAAEVAGLRLIETGLAAEGLPSDEPSLRRVADTLARIAIERSADIVQLNAAALVSLADFAAPVVAVHHGCAATRWQALHASPPPVEVARRVELVRIGLHTADIVVTPTSAFASTVHRSYGLAELPRAVHHGRSPLAAPSGMPHDFVFTAGRLWDEGENFAALDSAAGRIGVPVTAAGPLTGPKGSQIVFDSLHCLGAVGEQEVARWLSARPVFVSAALYEPSGMTVLDAAAAGCALVLSDIPAFRELWEEVAVFVDPRDESGFTHAIAALVADDFERAVLGRAARERASRYTPDAMAAQMASIYRSLLPAIRRPVLAAAREAA
jgi:glycosyltransferase involved in cell wall biosynthesis